MQFKLKQFCILSLAVALSISCSDKRKEKSSTTGWTYNDYDWGGFEKTSEEAAEQPTPPGMVLVEGGVFLMGQTYDDVFQDNVAEPRKVTVTSFYMDETEITNLQYREYLWWLQRFLPDYPGLHQAALPDTLVWLDELTYNDPYVDEYFRNPAFQDYPVVGVNWIQANDYSKWRTDRVNEMILIENGVLDRSMGEYANSLTDEEMDEEGGMGNLFSTDTYFSGAETQRPEEDDDEIPSPYQATMRDYTKKNCKEKRYVKKEDGYLLPDIRLATEAEFEYAAMAIKGNHVDPETQELYAERRSYPWNGNTMRESKRGTWQGQMLANFKRGNGDYAGFAGNRNDDCPFTCPVFSFMPNDFGLFHMAGNVNEWVYDIYRKRTGDVASDLNPARGNVFKRQAIDPYYEEPMGSDDSTNRMQYEQFEAEEIAERVDFEVSDARGYGDGDSLSRAYYGGPQDDYYDKSITSLVTDRVRVYKGGSWNDYAYYMRPGTRRYLDEQTASATIGFRCVMTRVGNAQGPNDKAGNQFRETTKVRERNAKNRNFYGR